MRIYSEVESAANTFRANYIPNAGIDAVSVGEDPDGDLCVLVSIDATCRVTIPDFIDGVPIRTLWQSTWERPFRTRPF